MASNLILSVVVIFSVSFAQAVFHNRECCPRIRNGTFIYSRPYGDKVFMIPTIRAERLGDWTENFGVCSENCAEMVTIHSAAENEFFLEFARGYGSVTHPGVWLGGRFQKIGSPMLWINGEEAKFVPLVPGEPNEPGLTCLNAAWDNGGDNYYKWRNDYCYRTYYHFACQRFHARELCSQTSTKLQK